MRRILKLFYPVLILLFLSSCTVTENLSENNSLTEFEASKFMIDLMEDISCWVDTSDNESVLDIAVGDFANNLAFSGSASDIYIDRKTDNRYLIGFSYNSLNKLIDRLTMNPDQDIVRVFENNGKNRMEININLENYSTLSKVIPVLSDPNLEVYGPVYNNPPYENRTEEQYLFMIDFIFGSGSESIKASDVTLNYTAPSAITDTNGIVQGNTATFSFPLIDFLLLHEPICMYCEW